MNFALKDPTKPHRHNTIRCQKGWFRKRLAWICIHCDQSFDERPDPPPADWDEWDIARADAIEFEREIHQHSMDWDPAQVGWNEHGAWVGCMSIHVIAEEP
jgi:hypothetical protein